jgi:hypothetical protein
MGFGPLHGNVAWGNGLKVERAPSWLSVTNFKTPMCTSLPRTQCKCLFFIIIYCSQFEKECLYLSQMLKLIACENEQPIYHCFQLTTAYQWHVMSMDTLVTELKEKQFNFG